MAVASSSETKDEDETILIHFLVDFVREGEDAKLILRHRGGCLGKDGMNQILQFLRIASQRTAGTRRVLCVRL
jgi:hypothetical protein